MKRALVAVALLATACASGAPSRGDTPRPARLVIVAPGCPLPRVEGVFLSKAVLQEAGRPPSAFVLDQGGLAAFLMWERGAPLDRYGVPGDRAAFSRFLEEEFPRLVAESRASPLEVDAGAFERFFGRLYGRTFLGSRAVGAAGAPYVARCP